MLNEERQRQRKEIRKRQGRHIDFLHDFERDLADVTSTSAPAAIGDVSGMTTPAPASQPEEKRPNTRGLKYGDAVEKLMAYVAAIIRRHSKEVKGIYDKTGIDYEAKENLEYLKEMPCTAETYTRCAQVLHSLATETAPNNPYFFWGAGKRAYELLGSQKGMDELTPSCRDWNERFSEGVRKFLRAWREKERRKKKGETSKK